jgi:hypothetical protein
MLRTNPFAMHPLPVYFLPYFYLSYVPKRMPLPFLVPVTLTGRLDIHPKPIIYFKFNDFSYLSKCTKKLPLPKAFSEKPGTPYGPSPYGTRLLGNNICIYDDITNRKNYTEKKSIEKKHIQ